MISGRVDARCHRTVDGHCSTFEVWRGQDLLGGTATWISPLVTVAGGFTELVPSWNASTPPGSWVTVEACVELADGADTGWLVVARWARDDPASGGALQRTTVHVHPGQLAPYARVDTDTVVAVGDSRFTGYQLRLVGHADPGSDLPTVTLVAAAAGQGRPTEVTSSELNSRGEVALDVPCLSQQRHLGHYPQWDRGGESWCSPASVSMVLRYWGTGPTEAQVAWVQPHEDPSDAVVDHVARAVWDEGFGGAGNWAFNTAYAATSGLEAYVTRLRSLRDAEAFLAAGIPLVASVRFTADDLPEAGYTTTGHLLVMRGLTAAGDVLVNDPASRGLAENDAVPTVFSRVAFERAWLTGSGGAVYVIHPPSVPLPPSADGAPWG